MTENPVQRLRESWEANAEGWSRAISSGAIASRVRGTNAAIVRATLARSPGRVLDLGCGEGWFARELSARDVEVVGVDGSAALIRMARERGGGRFHARSFDEIRRHPDEFGVFDAVVANFALLEEHIAPLFRALRGALSPGGVLLIQTVHPWIARGDHPYRNGWRTESFAGFGEGFPEPMPWYFRTLGSWLHALRETGFRIAQLDEPEDGDGEPLSLLLVAEPAADPHHDTAAPE